MNDIDFTGERLIPGKSPPALVSEHLARYEFTLDYVRKQKVLDLGCGEGYGSNILAEVAEAVTGVDIDPIIIGHAEKKYDSENLSFQVSDVAKLPFADESFDVVISFEVFEHITEPVNMLREAERVLKPSGKLIVSTPNGAVRVSSVPNPYHVREYTPREFTENIRTVFREKNWELLLLGQFIKGKNYSKIGVLVKNIYLDLKGRIGIPAREAASGEIIESEGADSGYEFLADHVELAEYLVAIVAPRG